MESYQHMLLVYPSTNSSRCHRHPTAKLVAVQKVGQRLRHCRRTATAVIIVLCVVVSCRRCGGR